MEDKARCCQNCKAPCAEDFKKVVDLQYSGLVIYLHTKKDEQKKADASKADDTYILHNTGNKQINRPEYLSELRRFKPKCGQCKTIVQRVRSLLDEIRAIKENEIIGVCEHCKRPNINKTCKRCDFIVSKFVSLHRKICEEKQERFKIWLCKVKHLLQAILQGESVCQHRVYKDAELERFLQQLKVPLSMREPDIDLFPSLDTEKLSSLQSLSESKEMLEELLSKIKFQGQLSSDDSLYPSPSHESCLCKLLKERQLELSSGFGTEKSRLSKDTELPSRESKDFSKLLSEEVYKELIKRLINLSKALPKGLHLNKNLIMQIIQTLNIAINKGLSTDIIVKLINQLSELSKTLSPHFSDDLNKEVIQGLIHDLNELLTLGSSKDLNEDLIQLLIDLSELLTNELSKSMTKEQSRMFSRSVHQDIARVLSKSAHKDMSEKISKMYLSERTVGSPKSGSKEIKQRISKSSSRDARDHSSKSMSREREVVKSQSKETKEKSPSRERREIRQRSPKIQSKEEDRSRDIKQVSPKDQPRDVKPGPPKGPSKDIKQSLPKDQSKDRRQVSPKDQSKDRRQESPKDQSKDVKQGPPKDQSKERRQGSPKDQNKDRKQSPPKDQNKEIRQRSPKEETKDVKQGPPKDQSKDERQKPPKDPSKDVRHVPPESQSKEIRKKSPKSKDDTQVLPKDVLKDKKIKEKQTLPKSLTKEEMQDSVKKESKEISKGSPKGLHKEKTPDLPKSKESKHVSPRSASKETTPSLAKKDISKGKSQPVSKDNIPKAHKDTKPGSSTIKSKEITQTSSKDANNELAQKMGNLNKALAGKSLDKDVIQELASGINKALAQKTPDATKKLIQELTDLCKPAIEGIPQTANMEKIQTLLKEANAAVSKGISNDQNKKTVQGLLNDLNKAIQQSKKEGQQPSRGLKKEISKELSSGLSSKAQAPVSRDLSKRRRKDLEDQGPTFDVDTTKRKKGLPSKHGESIDKSWSEEDIDKTDTMSTKKGSKKKKAIQSETKIKSKEKENIIPGDEKKKQQESKTLLKSSSSKVIKAKQLSQSVLLKLLSDNKEKAARHKLFQQRQQAKQKELERKRLKELALKGLKPLKKKEPPPPIPEAVSSSILECNIQKAREPKLMVAGNTIAPYRPYCKEDVSQPIEPLMFNTELEFAEDPITRRRVKHRTSINYEEMFRDGTIRYRLSDKEFINKGWTKLPTKKIMRRMNIYRMEPSKPHTDWFERHKKEKELFYDSGRKLADIDEGGRGHWYYQNGAVALDYYNATESNIGQRYVVYSSGEESDNGKLTPRTVLALFDVMGNGVVYDHYGNVRLKYNQSEGLIVDPKLGPPGKWKWHTLNDPPVLQQVFVNTRLKERDLKLERVEKPEKTQDASRGARTSPPEMLAIEFENFVKEKANKLLQKFKPFQIRMKAIKLNEQFSLKILDQANIYLLFREGSTTLKLNLGLLLISNEIIDTDTSEIADVATPYDKHPPKSLSVENIQKILKTVRSGKLRPPSEMNVKVSI